MNVKIAPSILSCDFGHLANEVKKVELAGADLLHVDIMDGHFVQNLTMGPSIVAAIKRNTKLFLDVHLMMYNPFDYVEFFVQSGANRIIFHVESTENVEETIAFIRKCNCQVGLALSPDTSVSMITKYLSLIDCVLVMTVHPGFGGQNFIEPMLNKVELVKELIEKNKIKTPSNEAIDIEVDGGINLETAKRCAKSGANVFVSGSFLFKSKDMKIMIDQMRKRIHE